MAWRWPLEARSQLRLRSHADLAANVRDNVLVKKPKRKADEKDLQAKLLKLALYGEVNEKSMNESDENGWGHIHHAAFRGFVKSVEKFVKANDDQLESETGDELRCTPLLLAVMSGNEETVRCLVTLGARVWATNSQNHGVVELCAFKQFIELLEYFIELNDEKLPVWKNLVKFLASEVDDEIEAAAKCLKTLTQNDPNGLRWKAGFDSGIVPTVSKVLKSGCGDEAKVATFHLLLTIIGHQEVKEQAMASGLMTSLIKMLKSQHSYILQMAASVTKELASVAEYAEQAAQAGAIPSLVKVTQTVKEPEVLVEVAHALASIVQHDPAHQQALGGQQGAISSIIGLFDGLSHKDLLLALTKLVSAAVKQNETNQTAFVQQGVAPHIITLSRVKHKELQMSAVVAVHRLAEGNPTTQKIILDEGVVHPLMQLLRRSRQADVQEETATALWALAGDDVEERRNMAELIGVQQLIEFFSSPSENLDYIGSEGLGVLAQGPRHEQTAIGQANGVHPLVRLLRSSNEAILLSAIRTLRHLSLSVGFVPHAKNQQMIAGSRGIKFLVALMVHSQNEIVQVEAAHTLAAVALGNDEIMTDIQQNLDFSFVRILKMMYNPQAVVRLLAGASLATFAYNSLKLQREIAEQGGVRFSCFTPFLQSDDEYFRCMAAFQVVVLAPIIPDEEQAISSAAGIKLLVELLQYSKNDVIKALAADSVARLAHTRAGVPSAFVSIEAVNLLCDMLLYLAEQVRGNAAIALGYLSYQPQATRQLLNRCRLDPYMMKILRYYTSVGKLSSEFLDGWKHYKQIGLPTIDEGRPNLIGRQNVQYKDQLGARPLTISSIDGSSTHMQSSILNTSGQSGMDGDKTPLTGRSSVGSRRTSDQTLTPRTTQGAQLSLPGSRQHSRRSSIATTQQPEMISQDA
ncbi:hypothetical protein CAPTEDRAFT_224898 [Capitella teleta]|uniref:Uncharacterized protein n=1 Tax=Capitella teleta TaxID=283909 RepID=R7VG92_CAPTE|nr:hypothetical protein CAPTEDRAFT_224898 [Capitella teleta]|eukprot:ELU14680.1 hypothetical protein CAPTEDRAFT_224898 [Capitella teleta]